MPILRAGPTLTELATRIFQSLSVCRVKWQHLRTLVIFLAVRSSRAAAGGKSLANSLVVPFSFWKAANRSQGLGLTEAGAGFQNLESVVTAWWDRILMKNVSPDQPVLMWGSLWPAVSAGPADTLLSALTLLKLHSPRLMVPAGQRTCSSGITQEKHLKNKLNLCNTYSLLCLVTEGQHLDLGGLANKPGLPVTFLKRPPMGWGPRKACQGTAALVGPLLSCPSQKQMDLLHCASPC